MKQHRALSIIVVLALIPRLACQGLDFVISQAPTPVRVPGIVVRSTERPIPTAAAVVPTAVAVAPTVPVVAVVIPTTVPPSAAPSTVPNPCTNPEAIITSPSMDSTVSGTIGVQGTASRANLDYWKGYRPNANTAFNVLTRSEKPLIDGVLVRISTKTFPNGVYRLQLAVVGKDGNYGNPCRIRITIAN